MNYKTLNLLYRCSRESGHNKLRAHDLNDTELMMMSFVYGAPGCSQDDIVKEMVIDKTTASKSLRKLEDKGLITRGISSADRRRQELQLTAEGSEKLSGLIDLHDTWLGEVMKCLKPDEQRKFEEYCERMLNRAQDLLDEDAKAAKKNGK